jgi:hypothetical protein
MMMLSVVNKWHGIQKVLPDMIAIVRVDKESAPLYPRYLVCKILREITNDDIRNDKERDEYKLSLEDENPRYEVQWFDREYSSKETTKQQQQAKQKQLSIRLQDLLDYSRSWTWTNRKNERDVISWASLIEWNQPEIMWTRRKREKKHADINQSLIKKLNRTVMEAIRRRLEYWKLIESDYDKHLARLKQTANQQQSPPQAKSQSSISSSSHSDSISSGCTCMH